MPAWNYATMWEIAAANLPEATALVQGDNRVTWAELDRRADGLAQHLLGHDLAAQDKVALYLYNCPEYLESCYAACKAGLVPVNTNYRYADDELVYLWDNADAVAVVFHGAFAERVERVRERVPGVKVWYWVDDGSGPCPDWAVDHADAIATPADGPVVAPWGRGADDIIMLYTGGTTGMPKGVMWRQDDLVRGLMGSSSFFRGEADMDAYRARITRPGKVGLPACPLMHGTGLFSALSVLSTGGRVALLAGRHLDIVELLDTYEREAVNVSAIVGDTFAKPMLAALDAEPDRWDISNLQVLQSSGVMWSEATKQGLLRHNPKLRLVDTFSSSEALGMGESVSTAASAAQTARFRLGDNARVIDDAGRDVAPGSGQAGRVAVKGFQPVGYYKDPEKSAATFVTIEGARYSIPGDYALVEADGTLTLLGRGSVCINTGGEKVFPEEVEEVLKEHPDVADAVVVGVPDDRFGEAITAVVEPLGGRSVDGDALIAFVKERLAHYKAPRNVVTIDTIGRAPNAKVDYKRLRTFASDAVGAT
ncbi:MAG: AMP-binding protein [Actinomycetota bacterium]|nr:AMP-binding protein [Actinomycetota bacterium]